MEPSFLQKYLWSFERIEGWFSYDAALMFMAYNQLIARHGIAANVLEIGVHHGLSTIAVATLRAPDARLYAVDLFEDLQSQNVSHSGGGNRAIFERNMREFFGDIGFIDIITGASGSLDRDQFPEAFSFCHVDGGHTRAETLHDIQLSASLLVPGGLVALDDYFNPEFPGVSEGAVEFLLSHPDVLRPIAIGYNKVLLQKQPAAFDLNAEFFSSFPPISHKSVEMWSSPALDFTSRFRDYFDLYSSTPESLKALGDEGPRAILAPAAQRLHASPGACVTVDIDVSNISHEPFPAGDKVFGISYHLMTVDRHMLQKDNDRTYFLDELAPGARINIPLKIQAPGEPGEYKLEVDLVWEDVMWLKEIGNPTSILELEVS